MLNTKLEAFVSVATTGSFSKAAKATFTTPTAMNKQVSLLEKELGVKLFERTYRGLTLTKAGQSLYMDAKHIIQYYNNAVVRAKNASFEDDGIIRIGSSPMTPVRMIYGLYSKICEFNPDIKIQIVNFENSKETADAILPALGNKIDIICTTFDDTLLNSFDCGATELMRLPYKCAVSFHHRLSSKEKLYISDLYGENILLLREGRSSDVDSIRYDFLTNHPKICISDFDVFDTDIFNLCETANYVALAIPGREDMYPILKTIPVNWHYTTAYGLLHAPRPTALVQRFVKAAKAVSRDL